MFGSAHDDGGWLMIDQIQLGVREEQGQLALCEGVWTTVTLCSPPLCLAPAGSFKITAVHWHISLGSSLATLRIGCTLRGRCFEG